MKKFKNWKEVATGVSAGLAFWVANKFGTDLDTLLGVATAVGLVGGGHKVVTKRKARKG